jgi:histidinol phosphatase-like PHP family hydrolase
VTALPLTDIHVHATHYRLLGAREEMTVAHIARLLDAESYTVGGIVEHLDTNPKHPISCLVSMTKEFRSISSSVRLFLGAELDYQDGAITIEEAPEIKDALGLDYYLAAAHGVGHGVIDTGGYIEDHHRRLMGIVARCDCVDVVAHPWCEGHKFASRGLIEAWRFDLIPEHYLREFIDAAKYHDKAIEINRKALADAGDPGFRRYLEMIRDAEVPVAVGSDAHSTEAVGSTEPLNALLEQVGFAPECLWMPERR